MKRVSSSKSAARSTIAELRTLVVNRLLANSRALDVGSAVKWSLYEVLVRWAPRLVTLLHEPESTQAFWASLRSGAIVIDGGSNRGGYSMLASKKVGPTGRVFAFEPDPGNFMRLERAVRDFPNVEPVRAAIGGEPGSGVLNLDTFHAGHSLVHRSGTGASVVVPVTTIDAFIAERGLPGIDVLKLDIEGSELDALRGMRDLLRSKRRPVILCEVHPPLWPEQLIEALAAFGYRVELLDAHLTGTVHAVPVHIFARPPA